MTLSGYEKKEWDSLDGVQFPRPIQVPAQRRVLTPMPSGQPRPGHWQVHPEPAHGERDTECVQEMFPLDLGLDDPGENDTDSTGIEVVAGKPAPALRRLLVLSTTPTALRFVQLVLLRSTVVTVATPASLTVMGTASAANDRSRPGVSGA